MHALLQNRLALATTDRQCNTSTRLLSATLLSLSLAGGCAAQTTSAQTELLRSANPEFTNSAVAVAWNQIAVDAAKTYDGIQDFAVNVRGFTMMHLAMHDALNSIHPVYERYAFMGKLEPHAQPAVAAAQAAHDVLVHIYPAQQSTLDSELESSLARIPNGTRKQLGVQLGKDAAAAIISERRSDAWDSVGSYAPKSNPRPGDYQFVPPLEMVFRPGFADAKPFAISDRTQFRGPPPPDLSSSAYASAYNEVKAFGAKNGSSRSQDQTNEALWWYEFAEGIWNRIASVLARQHDLKLYPAARMFALVNMGIADAYVAIWDAKRFYDRWRPYTAIRAGDTDGNQATDPDPTWEPLCVTPPVTEYPSAHAIQSAAAAEMLIAALDTEAISFTTTSRTAPPDRPERSFTSPQAAAAEAADSRVMCGIHFRYATDVGLEQGRALARSILDRKLRPRH